MRCGEIIEQTAKALNESWANASTITLNPTYDGSVYDIVGKTYNTAGERIAQWALNYTNKIDIPADNITIPFPGYMNNFKEADNYPEDKKNNKWNNKE